MPTSRKPQPDEALREMPGSMTTLDDLPPSALDAARYLLAALPHQDEEAALPPRLGFTSALSGEGVTFVARAVSAALAHDRSERVCFLDLNWAGDSPEHADRQAKRRKHRKSRHSAEQQGLESSLGLANVLRREASLRQVLRQTDVPRLAVVAAGDATPGEGQVFAHSERLSQLMEMLERHFDRLVLDLPPVLASSAAIPLARHSSGVVLVVRQGVTTETQVRAASERLNPIPLLGAVLNGASSKIPRPLLRRISNW